MEKFKRFDILLGNSIFNELFHFDNLPFTLYSFKKSYEMRNARVHDYHPDCFVG